MGMSGRVPTESSMRKQEIMRHYSEVYGSRDRFQSISPRSNIYAATEAARAKNNLTVMPEGN